MEVYSDGDKTLVIENDYDAESPRNGYNLGTFITWNKHYNSPDANAWEYPYEFLEDCVRDNFTLEEVLDEVNAGTLGDLHIEISTLNGDTYKNLYRNDSEFTEWKVGEEEDAEENIINTVVASKDILTFLNKKMVILPVYQLEHGGISYSTSKYNDRFDSGQAGYICTTESKIKEFYGCTPTTMKETEHRLKVEVSAYSNWTNGNVYLYTLYDGIEEVETVDGYYGLDGFEEIFMDTEVDHDYRINTRGDKFDIKAFLNRCFPEKMEKIRHKEHYDEMLKFIQDNPVDAIGAVIASSFVLSAENGIKVASAWLDTDEHLFSDYITGKIAEIKNETL